MTTKAAGISLTSSQQKIHQALLEIFSPQKAKQFITYMKKKTTTKKPASMPMKPSKMPMKPKKACKK